MRLMQWDRCEIGPKQFLVKSRVRVGRLSFQMIYQKTNNFKNHVSCSLPRLSCKAF